MKRKICLILTMVVLSSVFQIGRVYAEDGLNEYNSEIERISVKDFGAVGDGVSDDTEAVKTALTEANGRTVFVPKGTYCITDIDVSVEEVNFQGEEGALFRKISAKVEPMFTFRNCKKALVKGITFDAGRETFSLDYDTACVYFRNSSGVEITNCKFQNASREATAFLGNSYNITVHNCLFDTTSALMWVSKGEASKIVFENNVAKNGRINGVEITGDNYKTLKDIVVRNNCFYDFGSSAVQLKNVSEAVIENNYVENVKNAVMFGKPDNNDENDPYNVTDVTISDTKGSATYLLYAYARDTETQCVYKNIVTKNNSVSLEKGVRFDWVLNMEMTNENYTFAQNAMIFMSDSQDVKISDMNIEANDEGKALLHIKNGKSVAIENSNFSPLRTLFSVYNTPVEKLLSLKNVKANFAALGSNYQYNAEMYDVVEQCEDLNNALKATSISYGYTKIPSFGSEIALNISSDKTLSEIRGYACEGRTVFLNVSGANVVIKQTEDGNIVKTIFDKVYQSGDVIKLTYESGKWVEKKFYEKLTISSEPENALVEVGETAVFKASAEGGEGTYTYQWYKSVDGGETWTKTYYTGYRTSQIEIPVSSYMYGYLFHCVIENGYESAVTVNAEIKRIPISILSQPSNFSCAPEETAVFSISTGGSVSKYQWYKSIDGGNTWTKTYYTGFNSSQLQIESKKYMDGYLFRCEVTGKDGSVLTSDEAMIEIEKGVVIEAQPQDVFAEVGDTAVFNVSVQGNDKSLKYQWYKSVDGGETWTKTYYTGCRTSQIEIPVSSYMYGYLFHCVIENGYESAVTINAEIKRIPISILSQPSNFSCAPEETAVFSISTGGSVSKYQWYKSIDGGNTWTKTYYTGYNSSQLQIESKKYMDGYLFRCEVTGKDGSVLTSDEAMLSVKQ